MSTPVASTQRDVLVETGSRIFHTRGYTATGVRQVAAAAEVPMGSFTNHFRSKERFGIEVLDHYAAGLDEIMDVTLHDTSRPPASRIEAYFDAIEQMLGDRDWSVGCLIPDLAAEAPTHGDPLRAALASLMERHTSEFAAVLRDHAAASDSDDLAAVLLAAWHGSLLRTKVERSGASITRFRRVLRHLLSA